MRPGNGKEEESAPKCSSLKQQLSLQSVQFICIDDIDVRHHLGPQSSHLQSCWQEVSPGAPEVPASRALV